MVQGVQLYPVHQHQATDAMPYNGELYLGDMFLNTRDTKYVRDAISQRITRNVDDTWWVLRCVRRTGIPFAFGKYDPDITKCICVFTPLTIADL